MSQPVTPPSFPDVPSLRRTPERAILIFDGS